MHNTSTNIRTCPISERTRAEEIVLQSYEEYRELCTKPLWKDFVESIHEALFSEQTVIFLAQYGDTIAGVVTLVIGDTPGTLGAPHESTAEMRMLTVLPQYRKQGIGRSLVHRCLDHARQSHMKTLHLYTTSYMKAAIRMYEDMGFYRDPAADFTPFPNGGEALAYRMDVA